MGADLRKLGLSPWVYFTLHRGSTVVTLGKPASIMALLRKELERIL